MGENRLMPAADSDRERRTLRPDSPQRHSKARHRAAAVFAFAAAALFLPRCSALPSVRGHCTPQEVFRLADSLAGKTISARGPVEIEVTFCTEVACPPDNPCCNSCYYHAVLPVDAYNAVWLTGTDAGCRGGSCRADCPLVFHGGRTYEITGVIDPRSGPIVYLEISAWKPIG